MNKNLHNLFKSKLFFLAHLFVFFLFPKTVLAESYFDTVLTGVSKIKIVKDTIDIFKQNLNFWSFGKDNQVQNNTNTNTVSNTQISTSFSDKLETTNNPKDSKPDENIFLDKEFSYESGAPEEAVATKTKKSEVSYLEQILDKLNLNRNFTNQVATPSAPQPVVSQQPQTIAPMAQTPPQSSYLNSLLGGQGLQWQGMGSGQGQYGPPGLQATPVPRSATPYNGPGGSLPGDCGIPVGPIAYNIGGNSVSCHAKSVVVGFGAGARSGYFTMGYVNPLVQRGGNCSYSGPQARSGMSSSYRENRAADYNSPEAKAYIDCQLMHWRSVAVSAGQRCIPIDIDNCDSIGDIAYKNILDRIEELNKEGGVIIKVLTKNPHLANCNFFSHPAVVGAFVEEISTSDAQKVAQMRNKPEQVILFARGGTGSNQRVKEIESLRIQNSAYSYDSGGEYKNVIDCTYNP